MSVELPTDTLDTPYRAYGFDLSSPLSDGTASTRDDGRRRVLECPRMQGADVPTCIAAWHGVLHWLRFNDEPVITCLLGNRAQKCWPITTAVTAETSLGELLESVRKQWPEQDSGWLDITAPNHGVLLDQLRCHAIRLQDAPATRQVQSEFTLVRKRSSWLTDCAASRFSEAYQRQLMALWKQIVASMLANPAALLSAETYRSGGEVQKAAGPGVPISGNLIERFVDFVEQNPHKTAIVDTQGSVSFAGLHAQSSEWAQVLLAAGVVSGDCVGVAFNRNSKMAAAQIAVLKAGAVFVPMDANQPATRLQAMVDDTEMKVALTEAACVHAMQSALPGVRCLAVENLPPALGTPGEYSAAAGTDDAAYVVFTSGSTGRPKGVKVSHGNLLNFITYLREYLDADEVVSQFAPFTFDASVAEIHTALLNGGRLVILPGELIDDPDRLQAYMTEQQVTFAAFPPQYAKHLSPDRLPLLKTLMTAGSAPNHELIVRWQPHVKYINAYGPTETTILSTAWHATYVPQAHEPIVIGAPIANTEVRVVNRFNQCLPPGLVGELWIGGAGVAHGYVKRDALTRERFVTLDRIRWYRSGDLCCFDAHSQLIFAGRVDSQFKLRGHRLEPGEVEGALLTVKGVEQAAVVVVEVESVNQLVAFCAGERQPEQAMRESLGQVLPAWALPNRILWLANLPLTANGKTDYRKLHLQASRVDEPQQQQEYEDELEAQVAAIWGNVLQQPNISRDANFIHLGGDSLTSLVVMSAVKRLGYQVSSSQLLAHPRLADFAQLLRRTGRQVQRDYASCQGIAPLSPIQGWFFSLQLEQPEAFCQTLMFETHERLDAGRLHEAFSKLVVYHDQLRARFVRVAGDAQHAVGWRQEIASAAIKLPPIAALDLPDEQLVEASEHFRKLLAAELSIEQEPLFRVVLFITPERSRVVWVLHHLIVDTISHGILLDDLRHLYDSAGNGVESALPGKSISYLGWANKLWTEVTGHAKEQLEQWLPVLRGVAQADALPLQDSSNSYRSVEISQGRLSRDDTTLLLDSASRGYRQSPEELVLAATYLALGRELQLQRIAIDIEWHGRDEVFAGPQGIDRTVGWFTSVHPLCMAVPAPRDLGAWLVELKEARAGIPNRGRDFYALRYLSEEPAVRAQFANYRQPQVLFNFSGVVHRTHTGWRTMPVVAIEMGAGDESPYALSVESEIRNGELIVSLFLAPQSWPAGVFERLAEAIIECLKEVIQHCHAPDNRRWTPSDFPHLSLTQAQADQLPRLAKAAYPLTDMQQTLCRHKDTYQVFMCYRLPCPMDEPAWKSAVADWIGRHDCLRTHIYEWDGGDLCQVVLQDVPMSAVVHRAPAGAGSELAAQIMQKARSAPVVITQAPLFDLQAVDEGGEDFLIVLAIHHLIHDGWSIELLLGDLLETYRYFRGEVDRKPAAPRASMADIVAQQRKLQASAEWQAYWVGLPWESAACSLPSKPQRKTSGGAQRDTQLYSGVLDQHLVSAVRTRAQALGVTINSLWLTGYVCLLRYLGGQQQVRCGVIQNGRMEEIPGVETITGCCVNTLPLVLNIASSQSCADILAAVNGQLEKMREAAAFPLSYIHQAVKPALDDELFNSLFNIESQRYGTHDKQRRATLEGGYESTNYGFIFSLIEQPSNYAVRIGYDAGLYDVESVALWLEIFAQCMQAVIQQTDVPWRRLQLLPEKIRSQIAQWNQTSREYPDDRCVPELFREQVARQPTHPALLYKNVELNYAQLDARTDELARVLRARGVQPETIVGLVAERSIEMVIAILAIFKAGGAYVPIDPKYPAARVRHMVSDVGCSLVVFQRRSLAQVIPEDLAVTCLYLDEPLADVPDIALAPTPTRHSRQLAYVMYTSGSTGNPKGVMIEHRSIARLVKNTGDITFAPDDRILLTSAPGFDVTTFEVWGALLNGLTLGIVDEETLLDPRQLASEIRSKRIATLWLIAPLFNQLVQEQPDMFAGVKQLMIGGDALSAPHVQLARQVNPGLRIINGYGPTENTSFSTYHWVGDDDADSVPIGRPITNSSAYVCNPEGQLLPPGVVGELYVGGPGVARGYLNQPELTTSKFVPDPFSSEPQARLYRTGDLVRWRRDGLIDFLGRIDHQVKIRGFRVELGEIENAIASHEGVKQVIVLVQQDGNQKRLIAYLVARDAAAGQAALVGSIVAKLQASLPDYMVPAAFVMLDSMPRNANGKIDRARLPEPGPSAYAHSAYAEPANERERILWAIWKEALGIDSFGVTDDFFAIGGDSILAIQVVSRAARQGLVLTPRLIIEAKTIRNLAGKLTDSLAKSGVAIASRVAADQVVKGEQRLLPIQLKFLQDDRVDTNHYCQYARLALPTGISRDTLRSALAAIVARHDVLRLKFRETSGGWVAQYRPELLGGTPDLLDEFFAEEELTNIPDSEALIERAQADLDIKQGRLCRWVLLRGNSEQQLLWVMHHLIVDGVSWRVLSDDLRTALEQLSRGEQPALGAKSSSYQEWAARIHTYAYSPALEREKSYWLGQLALPAARVKFDAIVGDDASDSAHPREATTARIDVALSVAETSRLLHQANVYYATQTHELLIAALSRTLGEWLESDDVRIDVEGHGREDMQGEDSFEGVDLSQTVGWFTTLYPVHLADTRADLGAHIRRTKGQLAAVPRNGIGYGVLNRVALNEELDAARQRLGGQESDVLFNYLGQFAGTQQGGSYTSPRRRRTHALRINGMVSAGTLSFQFDYSTQQFMEATVQRVAERFVGALREIIEHCAGISADITASPFPLAGLSQTQIAALQANYPRVEDIYPCTGMQQGLLLFTSREPDSGVYLTQLRLELEGIDPDRLRLSWQELMHRHGILRTAFVDVGQSSLLQLVMSEVALPWRELDARTAVSEEAVQQLLSAERIEPFDVASAPLMRLLLVRVTEQRYCLSWTHHHALLDGWSMALLIKELLEVYTSNGTRTTQTPSYSKYIEWLQARDWKAAKHYWQSYFENLDVAASGSLPLASARTIDADATSPARYEQQMHTLELPAEITTRLAQLARSESVSLGTLMLAAWGLLLSKYNGEQEVLFGYATSGRPADLAGSESMVGLFINSLPIRLKIVGDATLAAWLKDIQRRQLDHDDHGFLALADIQRCSGARGGQTLFDSLVVVENYPLDRSALSADNGPRIIGVAGVEQNNLALNLAVYPGERLTLKLAYQTRLFDTAAIATMLRYLGQLLASFAPSFVKGGAQLISQLSLLTDEERERAIRRWNDTRRPYPQDRCLHELFFEQARVRDHACALVMRDERWSYRELAARADAIAAWLAREGVSAGDTIALSLNKQPDLIAAMLGILRIGAAYVPIAVDCPAPRRAFMVADAGIKRVVTKKELHERVAMADVAALFLEDVAGPAALDETCIPRVDASATAYVIYTSGTTGEPKGVQISQRNLVNFCRWCSDTALFKAGDAMTQFAPFTFDASAGEIFAGLLAGAELHLLDESLLQDPAAVARYLVDHAIRFAAFPPPYLEQIAPDAVGEGLTLLTAGSAPSVELVRRWAGRCRYVNGYGPTETTILSSAWNGDLSELEGGAAPPIGKPINNTFLYVVDSVGQLCAPGLLGEIVIGGAGVAQGYLNRPDLNQRHFGDDLWNHGGRLYRTGDLGCWREDGTIEFAGRRDRQVKLRGFRIELNEIELRLLQHPRVKEAAVAVMGAGADEQLLAWVTTQGEMADADASELSHALRSFLKQSLPEYMLPQAIVWLERLPLTANGKVDEKALPAPDTATLTDKQHVAPRTDTEARLVALWASVLKLRPEQVSATANFFEIGGHSLSAVRLVNAIAQSFDRQIAIRRIFDHAVLADLASYLERQETAPVVAIPVADRSVLLPLSFSQQRLWFIHQLEPDKAQYNQPLALSLRGPLNLQALQSALNACVARHEVLRTTFHSVEGRVHQQIQPPRAVPMPLSDLSSMSPSARSGQVERASLAEAVATFDLSTDLMLRARLLRLSQAEHVLLLTLHHIASDGWSLSILLKEFASLYESFCVGRKHSLPELPIQYADYATWQKSVLAGDLQRQLDYWKQELRGLPQVHGLPLDKPRPAQQSYQGAYFEHALGDSLGAALQRLAQSRQATLFMVLNAAFAHLLSRYSGESDIVVGTTVANRESAQTAPLIGFFVNTLLLRTDVSGNPSFAELLRQCRDKALGAYAHQQLPFDLLVDELQPQRSLSYNPLFQVMLSLENIDSTRQIALPELTLSHIEFSNATTAQFDLTLDVMQAEDQLKLRWTYATDLFESTTIQRMAGHFERLLQGISADPECPLNRLSLLSDAERNYLLHDLNDTRQPELIRATWPDLFAAQVERTPDAVAVVCSERGQDRTLTYLQLKSRADDVASALRARGVVPGELIALLDERGIDLLVMIVAVLNSGAAYLPLDPTHPPQRWLEILQQAGPRLLLVGNDLDEASAGLRRNWQSEKVIALATLLRGVRAPVARNYPALDDLAYVIYTSGSTGKPKGVMIEHRGMINNMLSKVAPLSLTAEDVIAQTASQCFDISVWQFLTALLLGARVAILPNEVTRDPRSLLQALQRERVSIWEPVPSVMQAVLACEQSLSSLRWVMPTGEALDASLVARWFAQYPHVPLMNAYGPAECSDDVAFQPIHAPVDRVLIGKPVANAQLYVVDEDLALVPLGAVGELAISGPVVGRGYLNLPEQTAVAFRNNPYARAHADQDHFDQRLYLTGDLVRRCGDGAIEYLGRKDFQIKLRGFRIEIGEIEARLNRHPQVQQAIVAVYQPAHADAQPADKQLIAYVVPTPGANRAQLTRENLCSHLRVELPEYMIPGAFMVLDALPLTATGKVDRKALPAPQEDQLKAEYEAPAGDHEQILASLWQELLKIERVGRRDNFFALGGHSLIIMELIARLRRQGLSLELRSVFDAADLAQLAARLTPVSDEHLHVVPPNLIPAGCQTLWPDMLPLVELSAAHIDRIAGSVPGGCANIQDIYPLAPLQEGILFHHLVRDAGDPYVNSVLLRFDTRGRLDEYLAALQQLIDRHDTLRSAVLWEGLPRAVQVVQRQAPLQVEEIKLDAARDAIEQFDLLMELSERYIDLRKAPIVRVQVAEAAAGGWYLLQHQHHITCDQVSTELEFQEIQALLTGRSAQLSAPVPYREFVSQVLARAQRVDAQAYFKASLGDVQEPTAPFDLLDIYRGKSNTEEVAEKLDADLSARIRGQCQERGLSPAALFHLAWALVLAQCSRRDDVVFGTVLSGRLQATREADKAFGLYINMLPLRLVLGGQTVQQALLNARDKLVELLKYEHVSLLEAQRCSGVPGSTPLFSAVLNYRHEADRQNDSEVLEGIEVIKSPQDVSNYLFDLSISDDGQGFLLVASIAQDIGAQRVMNYVQEALRKIVHALQSQSPAPLLSLSILPEREQHQLVYEFNDTARPEFIDATWPELFAAQVARTPDRIAVQCESQQLSYRALDERSNQLAQALRERGAAAGQIIGLLDQRGTDLLVMIVSVLKAGAAYMPLDPSHPSQRWLEVLQEGQPLLLVTGDSLASENRWLKRKWSANSVLGFSELLASAAGTAPAVAGFPRLHDLAYVLFTSGSTGKPKGVMIEHRGMINNMRSKVEPLSLSERDVIAQTASQCFDISVWQFLTAPLLGAKVSILSNATTRDPEALLDCIQAQGITIWEPVPSVIQAALPFGKPLPSLRWVMPTGEALSEALVSRWFEHYPVIPLMNAYGPAECSDDVSYQPIVAPVAKVLIGKPVANAHLHVVDENLLLLPIGVAGELAISGPVVGRGYLNSPEQTQAAFKVNPYARDEADTRLYLTGDLAKRLPDGSLEFVGRKDFQVKIRGFRIELGEIESCLGRHPGVSQAVVTAWQGDRGDKQLVAYVTRQAGNSAGAESLRAHLRSMLPDYMVPSAIVMIETLPLTPNGKVDRKALPAPGPAAFQSVAYAAPEGTAEQVLAQVWQDILRVEQVGRHDNFFDLGGNSILIIRMISELAEHGLALTVNDVYQLRTVEACAAAVAAGKQKLLSLLRQHAIRHRQLQLHGDAGPAILLIDGSHRQQHVQLQRILAAADKDTLPAFVRFSDDLQAAETSISTLGLASLAQGSEPQTGNLAHVLAQQIDAFENALISARCEETFPFSPMQQDFLKWPLRETFTWVTIAGWYSEEDLKRAFHQLACEQDLLRALLDSSRMQWQLLRADSFAGLCPFVSLKGSSDSRVEVERRAGELLTQLRDRQRARGLPYLPLWISASDTEHHFLIANDHLISDGITGVVLENRLAALLNGSAPPPQRTYRDYVRDTWLKANQQTYDALAERFDYATLGPVVEKTTSALRKRARLPLRSVSLRVPLNPDIDAIDQAFECFKQAAMYLTRLSTVGALVHQYGRQLGSHVYFDQVGLFLDKIPLAIGADTPIAQLSDRSGYLQQEGINLMSLEKAPGIKRLFELPDLGSAMAFNFMAENVGPAFQQEADPQFDADRTAKNLEDFRGFLFEAYCTRQDLMIHCAFRGRPPEEQALMEAVQKVRRYDSLQPASEPIQIAQARMIDALEVKDVRKSYGDFAAVKGVSFRVKQGTCFGILGPNGAGKTSLLGMIEGITPITAGSISVLGMDVATQIKQIQPRVGVQLQQNNYFQFLTVAELLRFYQELRAAVAGRKQRRSIDSLLDRLDLRPKLKSLVDELSGGQKQRLSIAIALLEDPDVIFLDEPTSALDPHSRLHIWEFIEQLKQNPSKTVILTTHYMEEAERLCDEIMIMNDGKIIAQGNPAQLVSSLGAQHSIQFQFAKGQFKLEFIKNLVNLIDSKWDDRTGYLEVKTRQVAETVREILAMSSAQRIKLVNFDINRPSLEDVFLSHTNKELQT